MDVIIIQARMGSTRLPGKVLMRAAGRSLLRHLIERLRGGSSTSRSATTAPTIVVATTDLPEDDPVEKLAQALGAAVYRGSESDVLDRFYRAAEAVSADTVVRLTGDCPLLDPDLVFDAIDAFHAEPTVEYLANTQHPFAPLGMSVEVFSFAALERAHREATQAYQREHVTPYFYEEAERFRTKFCPWEQDLSHYRLTVDTIEDLALVRRIFAHLQTDERVFRLCDIVALLEAHPDWLAMNATILQKSYLCAG